MIIRVERQKYFSNEDPNNPNKKKSGIGWGTVALGTAATAAGLFGGARMGMLGARAQMSSNKLWAKSGRFLGSQKMIDSASRGYAQGSVKNKIKAGVAGFKDMEVGSTAYNRAVAQRKASLVNADNSVFGNIKRQYKPNTPAAPVKPTTPPPAPATPAAPVTTGSAASGSSYANYLNGKINGTPVTPTTAGLSGGPSMGPLRNGTEYGNFLSGTVNVNGLTVKPPTATTTSPKGPSIFGRIAHQGRKLNRKMRRLLRRGGKGRNVATTPAAGTPVPPAAPAPPAAPVTTGSSAAGGSSYASFLNGKINGAPAAPVTPATGQSVVVTRPKKPRVIPKTEETTNFLRLPTASGEFNYVPVSNLNYIY